MFEPEIPQPHINSGFTSAADASKNLDLDGNQYAEVGTLNNERQQTNTDVIVAKIGRNQIIFGSGGYYAPRS